jgi:hypothetical protein
MSLMFFPYEMQPSGNLKKRGYSSNLIDKQFQKVDKLEREDLLKHNQPKQSDRVPLVSTYTDALPNIHTILRKHLDTLYNSEEMKQVFSQPPIVAFRIIPLNIFCNKRNKSHWRIYS